LVKKCQKWPKNRQKGKKFAKIYIFFIQMVNSTSMIKMVTNKNQNGLEWKKKKSGIYYIEVTKSLL